MFITRKYLQKLQTIEFADLFDNFNTFVAPKQMPGKYYRTITNTVTDETTIQKLREAYNTSEMEVYLDKFHEQCVPYLDKDLSTMYETFRIPKRTGGSRRIDAPNSELTLLHMQFKHLLENVFRCLAHDTAYAYVEGRSTVEAMQVHQANKSKWFLKIDLKDFFPSCNAPFILTQLLKLFPFAVFSTPAKAKLYDIIKLCMLNEQLPQGTCVSPILTNLVMLPIDYQITKTLRNFNNNTHVYTRYADDLLITSKYKFDLNPVVAAITEILNRTPLNINPEKTRLGSAAGRNWNLGLMLNKDNNITIGWKKKEYFKAMTYNFLKETKEQQLWDFNEAQSYLGLAAYYSKIQPDVIKNIIQKCEQKLSYNFKIAKKQYNL